MNSFERLRQHCENSNQQMLNSGSLRTLGAVIAPHTIDFTSNDYLGLRVNPLLAEATGYNTKEWGVGSGASRVVVQTSCCTNELELATAKWLNWPRVLFCTSGFNANMSIFEAVARFENVATFLDVRAHASLFIGGRASQAPITFFRHGDYLQLEKKLLASKASHKIVFVESLHSMDGTFENAAALSKICEKTGALIVIDEAHSAGICGSHGMGWASEYPELRPHTLAVMFGCGKAIGVSGAFIAAPEFFIDCVINTSKAFIYSTAPSPLISNAVSKAVNFLKSENGEHCRQKLRDNIDFAAKQQAKLKLSKLVVTPNSPILFFLLGSDEESINASNLLQKEGFMIKAMRPPTVPRKTARLRIILKATHTTEEIERLFLSLSRFS